MMSGGTSDPKRLVFVSKIPFYTLFNTNYYLKNIIRKTSSGGKNAAEGLIQHSAIYYKDNNGNNKMVIFGGQFKNGSYIKDVLEFDLTTNTWTFITPSTGPSPHFTVEHTAIYYKDNKDNNYDKMVVFGGLYGFYDASNKWTRGTSDEVWVFNLNTRTWSKMETKTKHPARFAHTAIYYKDNNGNNKMVVFGGRLGNYWYNNTYELNLDTKEWKNRTWPYIPWQAYTESVYYKDNNNNDIMLLFWSLLYAELALATVASNRVWKINLTTNKWQNITPSTGPQPGTLLTFN